MQSWKGNSKGQMLTKKRARKTTRKTMTFASVVIRSVSGMSFAIFARGNQSQKSKHEQQRNTERINHGKQGSLGTENFIKGEDNANCN